MDSNPIEATWNFSGANNYETIAEIVLQFMIIIDFFFFKFWCNYSPTSIKRPPSGIWKVAA